MSEPFCFTIISAPRTKKTSNRVVPVRSKSTGKMIHRVLPSLAYVEWNELAQQQLYKVKSRLRGSFTTPVNVAAIFYRHARVGDAVGFYNALADTLQEAGIVENDRLITQWDGSRMMVDHDNPRVDVTITVLPGEQLSLL